MQEIISYHVVPPGNLTVRQEDGQIRKATDVETIRFFRMGVSLTHKFWRKPSGYSAPTTSDRQKLGAFE